MTHEEARMVARVISRSTEPGNLARRLQHVFPDFSWQQLIFAAECDRERLLAASDDVDSLPAELA